MKLLGSRTVILTGIALIAAGFLYDVMFAGIPYQDPPPDLLEQWKSNKTISANIMMAGLIVFSAGVVLGLLRKLTAKR